MLLSRKITTHRRSGAALVEAAFVLPVLFLLIFGFMEMARMGMAFQLITNAAIQCCRIAVIDGYSQSDVTSRAQNILAEGGIPSGTYTLTSTPGDVSTTHHGDTVTVSISVPYRNIAWLTPLFLSTATLKSSSMLSSERP